MPSDLLLKATRELLDGWCGPVVDDTGEEVVVVDCRFDPATGKEGYWVIRRRISSRNDRPDWADRADLYLDLARAECRDRVARVLAAKLDPHKTRHGRADRPMHALAPTGRAYMLLHRHRHAEESGPGGYATLHVPCERCPHRQRLPDGSRLVDAQALLVVAREVL